LGLRAALGDHALAVEPGGTGNLLPLWWVYAAGFLGAVWVLPWMGFRRRPPELQRMAIALMATHLPLQLLFGRVREVRLLLPLAVALIPLALLRLQESEGPDRET
jgi:hypothetical protein